MKISAFINLFKSDSGGSSGENSAIRRNRSFPLPNSPANNDVAMSYLISQTADMPGGLTGIDKKDGKNSDPVVYKIVVSFPKGKTELTYDQLEKAVIKTILQKNGINPSVAAVERLAERHTIDFTPKYDAGKREYVFSEKNGLMMNVSDKKANRYDVPISASVEKAIIGDIELAKNITASGEKAFSELSMNERLQMVFDRAGKDLPQDVRDALKLIDPKMLVGSMAIGAALSSLVSKGLIASEALVLVGGAVTMAQLISYMGDAEHILNQVAQAKKPEDLDVPAKQTAELIKSGAVDIFLTVAGYGVGKVAPKISKTAAKISEKAGQFGDDIANVVNKAKAKGAKIMDDFNEGLQKLGKTLIPETELATPSGVKFDPSEISMKKNPLEKINDPMEARRVGDPIAGTPEHKDLRWGQYQERGGKESYEVWSKKYEVNIHQARKANVRVDKYHAQLGWGDREVVVEVEKGVFRRLDIADKMLKKGIEHKTGDQSLGEFIRSEVERDAKLVKKGWDIEWYFEGTASKPLLNALEKAGIRHNLGGSK